MNDNLEAQAGHLDIAALGDLAKQGLELAGGVLRLLRNREYKRDENGQFAEVDSPAPARISVKEADELLSKGVREKDADGNEVNFGMRLKQKLEADTRYSGRKELLEWGREAVRSGKRVRDDAKGEERDHYYKHFRDEQKRKAVMVVVDVRDGEAFNLFRVKDSYLKSKGFMNRRGNEPGEHPPVAVLRAIADAGRTPDCTNHAIIRNRLQGLLSLAERRVAA